MHAHSFQQMRLDSVLQFSPPSKNNQLMRCSSSMDISSLLELSTVDSDTDTDYYKDSTEFVEDSVDLTECLLPDKPGSICGERNRIKGLNFIVEVGIFKDGGQAPDAAGHIRGLAALKPQQCHQERWSLLRYAGAPGSWVSVMKKILQTCAGLKTLICKLSDLLWHCSHFINAKLRACTIEEEVLNIIHDEVVSGEKESIPVSVDSAQDKSICSMRTGIVFDTCLMSLAKKAFSRCAHLHCTGKIDLELHVVATAMKVVSHCCHGHKSTWWSQPLLKGVPAGNIQLVSSIVLSGNNYRKIALMLKFLNMLPVGHQSFLKIRKSHVQPSVTNYWKKMQGEYFLELTHPIVVLGDRCNNSHVRSEKYHTYTMMDNSTHRILDVQVIDAREGTRRLRNLEISGFQRAFQCLIQNDLNVSEIVTDADPQLLSMMRSKYPKVLHQIDLWHGIKAVYERLNKVTASSANKDLQPWISDIVSHFMYCCRHSNGDANTLMARWRSILHHTVNMHEWQLGDGSTAASCEHGPLADKEVKDKKWLIAGSPAHHALREVVYDKWLTSHLNYFVQARVTNELESFHNHIQMYATKNFTYEFEDYQVRALLAAIDYNSHIDREYQRNADGEIVYHRMYSKRRKHWRAVPAKVQKQYYYFEGLREDIMKMKPSKDVVRQQPRGLGARGRRVPTQLSNANST
ncbi:uncharacterized protein [Heterodontus francisci]|uniref:uncharacterized protein n=1 Tax=Heterodontus francisci TaxID=7792 RepID=UPI00355C2CB0